MLQFLIRLECTIWPPYLTTRRVQLPCGTGKSRAYLHVEGMEGLFSGYRLTVQKPTILRHLIVWFWIFPMVPDCWTGALPNCICIRHRLPEGYSQLASPSGDSLLATLLQIRYPKWWHWGRTTIFPGDATRRGVYSNKEHKVAKLWYIKYSDQDKRRIVRQETAFDSAAPTCKKSADVS